MHRPTVGDLLKGISESLRQSVLPALGPGAAQRQLKSALHTLGRLERSWDLLPAYLVEDNTDMRECVASIQHALRVSGIELPTAIASQKATLDREDGGKVPAVPGFNDPALTWQGTVNIRLQSLVVELDRWLRAPSHMPIETVQAQTAILDALYNRMVDREIRAWSTDSLET